MKSFLGLAARSLVALVAVGCTVSTSSSSGGSGGIQSPDRATPAGGVACYADTRTGRQDVAWSDLERLIDAAYLGRTTYFGHDQASAKSTAKTIRSHFPTALRCAPTFPDRVCVVEPPP
jgi:hypothetical protein